MLVSRTAGCVSMAVLLAGFGANLAAQRGRGATPGEKPKVDVVQSVGCVERKSGSAETWWLTRAVDPRPAPPGIFSTGQIDAARQAPLGGNAFQLVGVADFLDADGLLKSGRRSEFTTTETANATGVLGEGRKVLVKGMLIDAGEVKRINLLTTIRLADSCG